MNNRSPFPLFQPRPVILREFMKPGLLVRLVEGFDNSVSAYYSVVRRVDNKIDLNAQVFPPSPEGRANAIKAFGKTVRIELN